MSRSRTDGVGALRPTAWHGCEQCCDSFILGIVVDRAAGDAIFALFIAQDAALDGDAQVVFQRVINALSRPGVTQRAGRGADGGFGVELCARAEGFAEGGQDGFAFEPINVGQRDVSDFALRKVSAFGY